MSELEELRKEVADLRRELADLRGGLVVHHYHHQAAPAPFHEAPRPSYPGGPYPTTCYQGLHYMGVVASNGTSWC